MEALVISAGEPQLERCLESVKSQTVSFSNVVHIADVIPQSKAFNDGIEKVTDEWVMKVDGDMVLHPDAVEKTRGYISSNGNASVYAFMLYDDFMAGWIIGCKVYKTEAVKKVKHPDFLKNDIWVDKKLERMGFRVVKPNMIIGTHAENPDEFQIFRRFYIYGVKYGRGNGPWEHTRKMFETTKEEKYAFAMDALEFGMSRRTYPGSHNIDFDRKMYEEFKSGYRRVDNQEV